MSGGPPNPLAAACHRPFANGTEGEAWLSKWCEFCVHDHDAHDDTYNDVCHVSDHAYFPDDVPWPEAWLPEPDDGRHFLPSRLICRLFEPCTKGGCTGDPGAAERAERVEIVQGYWRDRMAAAGSSASGTPRTEEGTR